MSLATSQPAGVVLLNRQADGGRALALRRPIEAWLARHTPGVALLVPDSVDAALATLAILATRTRVVLVGGDGTLQRMLPALLRCGHRVGLVPVGRQLDGARALGIAGLGWREALPYALHAPTAAVDLGQLDTEQGARHFLVRVGALQDARRQQITARLPAWLGPRGRRALGGLASLWGPLGPDLRVWVNGQLEHDGPAWSLSVCNAPTGHGGRLLAPTARIDDHRLDTLVIAPHGPLGALRLAQRLRLGRHVQPPRVALYSTRKLLVDAAAPLTLAVDGEAVEPSARFSVRLLPRALHLVGAHMLAERDPPAPETALVPAPLPPQPGDADEPASPPATAR